MGNCVISRDQRSRLRHRLKTFLGRLGKTRITVDESPVRKRGVPSNEAVQWFVERDQRTFSQSVSFVPWVIQKGILSGSVTESTESVIVFRGDGAVVFCDASGFTKLTEYLAQKPNGAELLSSVLNRFFTPLIDIISSYRGDIIKFSGDALTILFGAETEDATESEYDLACGSGWSRCVGHSSLELAVLRAVACCTEIHKRLDNFDTGIPDSSLSFHIGVGCGTCVVLHVGGESSPEDLRTKRFEYVICGEPLEQIAHACHYAAVYETVVSPQAWELVKDTVIEGPPIDEDTKFKRVTALVTNKHTYATIRSAAEARDHRASQFSLKLSDMNLTRRYIPSAVFQQMANGTLDYVNEIRNVTVFFICVPGLDVSSPRGAITAQDLMSSVQQACFEQEGQVNKFLVDDKGLLFLCVFGTPPMVHTDDPLRAIYSCFKIIQSVKRLGLIGHFGLSTGRVFCGMVGSSARQEYTILGDSVNVAARFMQIGKPNIILADQTTYDQTKGDLDYDILEAVKLKGKLSSMPMFQPRMKQLTGVSPLTRQVLQEVTSSGIAPKIKRRGTQISDLIYEGTVPGVDPLLQCSQWRELKLIRSILKEKRVTEQGGTIVLSGRSGIGKDQLCQQILATVREKSSGTVTVYATDQGQRTDRARPLIELIETCLSVASQCGIITEPVGNKLKCISDLTGVSLREISLGASINDETGIIELIHLNSAVLSHQTIVNSMINPRVSEMEDKYLNHNSGKLNSAGSNVADESKFLDICEKLVERILQDRPIALVMTISRGTSIFNFTENPTFWKLVSRMSSKSHGINNPHPLLVVLLCQRIEDTVGVVHTDSHEIELQPLNRNCVEEYVSKILQLEPEGTNNMPTELVDYVQDLTQGNPLYVMETLEQLVAKQYISRTLQGYIKLNCDLNNSVSLSNWSHTSMVGRVICQLEALAPQEAAIVKMASVFEGPFSVLDIAASLKSAYVNARRFDNYRMYRTIARLVRLGILSAIPVLPDSSGAGGATQVPINDMSRFPKDTDIQFILAMNKIPFFILDSYLIRKVARGMILQQQALTVKRQAMISRVIVKDVPARMDQRRIRLENLHIPYYNLVKL